jgi:hypothetical protein
VSQRLSRAARIEVDRGSQLAARLLGRMQELAVAP